MESLEYTFLQVMDAFCWQLQTTGYLVSSTSYSVLLVILAYSTRKKMGSSHDYMYSPRKGAHNHEKQLESCRFSSMNSSTFLEWDGGWVMISSSF